MTFHELYQLKDLRKEIEEQKRRLPHVDDERAARLINESLTAYWRAYVELEMYISNIHDSFTRRIFRLRFIDGKTWTRVAIEVGGGQTGDSVRKIVKRFLDNE